MDHKLIWLQPDAEVPEMEKHIDQSEKVMLTIVWNLADFHLVDCLCRRAKINETIILLIFSVNLPFGAKFRSGRPIEN
jgi:hypothetical protein